MQVIRASLTALVQHIGGSSSSSSTAGVSGACHVAAMLNALMHTFSLSGVHGPAFAAPSGYQEPAHALFALTAIPPKPARKASIDSTS